ncbi:MAG: hypothetical protein Q9N62_07600 [Ghiorsea sp.]|nr:hypothetical protein [Ghiorsea sp.]
MLPIIIKPLWARDDKVLSQLGRDRQGQWEYEQTNPCIWYVVDTLKKVHLQFWHDQKETVNSGPVQQVLESNFKQYDFSPSVIKLLSSLIRPNWDT